MMPLVPLLCEMCFLSGDSSVTFCIWNVFSKCIDFSVPSSLCGMCFLCAICSLHIMCNGVIDFSGTWYHRIFSVLGHTRRRRRLPYTHSHTQTPTHPHTPTHTITEMHSLAVFLAKAGYGTVAEMEETLKDMVRSWRCCGCGR